MIRYVSALPHKWTFHCHLLVMVVFACLGTPATHVLAQVSYRHRDVCNIVSHYTTPRTDGTGSLLRDIGFRRPKKYKDKWDKLPSARKLDIAYRSAERRRQGGRMLRRLADRLGERFESARYEEHFDPFLQERKHRRRKIRFAKEDDAPWIEEPISPRAKKAILAITKYTDRGALGGVKTVLGNYGGLSDDTMYHLLTHSNSNNEALSDGAQLYAMNGTAMLDRTVQGLDRSYPGLGEHPEIKHLCTASRRMKMVPGQKIANIDMVPVQEASWRYKRYLGKKMRPEAFAFDSMITDRKKWGGVIIGNKATADTIIHTAPTQIVWLQDERRPEWPATGTLEFKFCDRPPLIMTGVFLEDVYAAYKILFDLEDTLIPHVNKGDGVGLINASGDEVSHIDIHPAIANLDLGRCAARADVWLRAEEDIRPLLHINNEMTPTDSATVDSMIWIGKHGGWKYFASPLLITCNDGFIDAVNTDTAYRNYALRFSHSIYGDRRFYPFNKAVPLLCNSLNDFARVNSFAKLFAILRWAKEADAQFLNKPDEPQMYAPPHTIHVAAGRLITR